MTERRRQISHLVQVARVRIETAVVEIEGGDIDDEEAERQAIEEAEFLPREVWTLQPFDANANRPHVQAMLSHDEFAENGKTLHTELVNASEPIRYLLLKANCDTGEADLVLQPWLVVDQPDLLASDLVRAWIDVLQDLGVTHLSQRLDDLAAGSPPLPSDQVLFNVKHRSEPEK